MQAIRHKDVLTNEDPDIDSNHLQHMYSGRFAWYYYRRFDMVLEQADIETMDSTLVLGGGTGVFTLSLLDIADNIQFIDITSEKLADADTLFEAADADKSAVNFMIGDGTQLSLATDSVDVAFALDTLEHIPDSDDAIAEIQRVLRPGGQLLASVPIEVGPPLAVRELYRFATGRRHKSNSVREFIRGVIGRPSIVDPFGHRGYDFRDTVANCREFFANVLVSYCPFPMLRWANPTAIITASN